MIMDERLEFCDAQALNTGAAGTYLIGDVIDLGSIARDIGEGDNLELFINVSTAVTSAGSATVQFTLASDAQASIATDGTATVHWQSAAIPKATLVAGYNVVRIVVPMNNPAYERYLGILQTTGTAALTAGAVDAGLVKNSSKVTHYADASN
jgi:hypothetical protein